MQRLATELECGIASVYRLFPSKDALIAEILHDALDELHAAWLLGLAHVDDLAEEWSERIAVPRDTIRFYLSNNIHYILDEACLRGLDLFYQLAAECGALPPASVLTIL